jgi:pimeloyl-ACP methyl ester carboxylesterase
MLVLAIALASWLARPLGSSELASRPDPAPDYEAATSRIDSVLAGEAKLALQDVGAGFALLHGSEAETSVVIFHGYTDVPGQFSAVARGYYEAGANVWVPRMPYHGYRDRMTTDLSRITADLLRRTADAEIDIAAGLGRKVVVVGLSGGGAMAAWAATERPDVARTIIISPLMLPSGYRPWMVRPLARLVAMLPDAYTWWNDKKVAGPGPEYPRYSRHGIVSYLMLVERVKADGAGGRRPVTGEVVIVSNLHDQHLDTHYPIDVMRPLVRDPRALRVITIPASEGLLHDIVGLPGDNRPRLRVAYRYLSEAMGISLPDPLAESAVANRQTRRPRAVRSD